MVTVPEVHTLLVTECELEPEAEVRGGCSVTVPETRLRQTSSALPVIDEPIEDWPTVRVAMQLDPVRKSAANEDAEPMPPTTSRLSPSSSVQKTNPADLTRVKIRSIGQRYGGW